MNKTRINVTPTETANAIGQTALNYVMDNRPNQVALAPCTIGRKKMTDAETIATLRRQRDELRAMLGAASGYMLNASIGLKTGDSKAKVGAALDAAVIRTRAVYESTAPTEGQDG